MSVKKVSKKFVKNDFSTIGLTLILYSLFVLFIPTIIDQLFKVVEIGDFYGFELKTIIKMLLIIIGTIFPFLILKFSIRKNAIVEKEKIKIPFFDVLCRFLMFFSLTSIAIFATTTIAAYFDIPGEFISSIGLRLDDKVMDDVIYLAMFIVVTPIIEEIAFRGILLKALSKYGKYFALFASAIVFSLAHGSFIEMIPAFIMGMLLNKIALRYKSIKPTIFIHILFNLSLYILIRIPEKYSFYTTIGLAFVYILSIVLYVTHVYKPITLYKLDSFNDVNKLFYGNGLVIVSFITFIGHSIFIILLETIEILI